MMEGSSLDIRLTQVDDDPAWDDFLGSTPLGQFQQSSYWGQYKACEGWQVDRVIFCRESSVVAGFQVLTKRIPLFGCIGYISKGPVIGVEDADLAEAVLQQIKDAAGRLRLRTLIVHPPDMCSLFPSLLPGPPFSKNRLIPVMDANLVVDLGKGLEGVETEMRRTMLQEVRQARRSKS